MGKKVNKLVIKIKSCRGTCSYGYKEGDVVAVVIQDPEGYQKGQYNLEDFDLPEGYCEGSMISRTSLEHTDLVIKGDICPAVFAPIYRHAFCMLLGGNVPWAFKHDFEGGGVDVACPDPENLVVFEMIIQERSEISGDKYIDIQSKIAEKTSKRAKGNSFEREGL